MSSLTFCGGPLGTKCTEVFIQCEELPLSELPYLFCVSEIGPTQSTFCQLQLPGTTFQVREKVDLTRNQLKSPRVKSGCLKSQN